MFIFLNSRIGSTRSIARTFLKVLIIEYYCASKNLQFKLPCTEYVNAVDVFYTCLNRCNLSLHSGNPKQYRKEENPFKFKTKFISQSLVEMSILFRAVCVVCLRLYR